MPYTQSFVNICWLDQIQDNERREVGDRAYFLSQLLQQGYPVPNGFIVPNSYRQNVLDLNKVDLSSSLSLDVDNYSSLQQQAIFMRSQIDSLPLNSSNFTATLKQLNTSALLIRPSLTVLKANQIPIPHPQFLQSHFCPNHPEAFISILKEVWGQLFSAKSLFYWHKMGFDWQDLSLGVLVLPLWSAQVSGTLQATEASFQIEATWGQKLAISNGVVQPDFYQVMSSGKISQRLGNKTRAYRISGEVLEAYTLSDEQQKQLALDDRSLQELITLGQQISCISPTFTLEWIFQPQNAATKLQILQFLPTVRCLNSEQAVTDILLQGIPASKGRAIAPAYVLSGFNQHWQSIPSGTILVVKDVAPDWLPLLKNATGVIAEQGGMTCHAAIISRELGIPAIVSVSAATEALSTGETILIDGDRGIISRVSETTPQIVTLTPKPINYSTSAIATSLLVNLSQANLLNAASGLPVDGVGLLRSEFLVGEALENQSPQWWLNRGLREELIQRLVEAIALFSSAFSPRPVYYRSVDWRQPGGQEAPMLGLRGTFSYANDPTLFDLELAALAQLYQSGVTNLRLILPFVRTVEEFKFCRRHVEAAGLMMYPQFELWIMAEVPSVLFLLPEYVAAGCQGISIGTNDLTQLLLGVDRDRPEMASFNGLHPTVERAIAQLIQTSHQHNIPCSICGQAPALYPDLIDKLVDWGITSISVEPDAVERTYQAIARAEQRLLLNAARLSIFSRSPTSQ